MTSTAMHFIRLHINTQHSSSTVNIFHISIIMNITDISNTFEFYEWYNLVYRYGTLVFRIQASLAPLVTSIYIWLRILVTMNYCPSCLKMIQGGMTADGWCDSESGKIVAQSVAPKTYFTRDGEEWTDSVARTTCSFKSGACSSSRFTNNLSDSSCCCIAFAIPAEKGSQSRISSVVLRNSRCSSSCSSWGLHLNLGSDIMLLACCLALYAVSCTGRWRQSSVISVSSSEDTSEMTALMQIGSCAGREEEVHPIQHIYSELIFNEKYSETRTTSSSRQRSTKVVHNNS